MRTCGHGDIGHADIMFGRDSRVVSIAYVSLPVVPDLFPPTTLRLREYIFGRPEPPLRSKNISPHPRENPLEVRHVRQIF